MPTDPALAEAIELSLEIAGERGGDLTPIVYGRLFERQPQMKVLFWRDTTDAVKGEMLMRVFEAILDFIRARQYADHLIQTEVATHAGYDCAAAGVRHLLRPGRGGGAGRLRRRLDRRHGAGVAGHPGRPRPLRDATGTGSGLDLSLS